MKDFAARRPEMFGIIVTFVGVLFFVPDALVIRLIGGDTMDIAVWRGLFAGVGTLGAVLLFFRSSLPGWAELLTWPALAIMFLQGIGSMLFLGAMGATSVAHTLLILAASPFLTALLSWLVLGERIDRMTAFAILAVFVGVGILASASLSGGGIAGDVMAFGNALSNALYYVVLRKVPGRNLIVPIAIGYVLTSAMAWPLAPHVAMSGSQLGLLALSGGVILAGGVGILMIGPRYLPAAEVTMITMLEIVLGPLLVWAVIGENPGGRSLIGGAVILAAITAHALWRLRGVGQKAEAVADSPA